ncbi:ATP-binding protein [Antarcticimicrobium sediminis]|nr:ATP-binding protein [Antarcticimicrobium sediminis]
MLLFVTIFYVLTPPRPDKIQDTRLLVHAKRCTETESKQIFCEDVHLPDSLDTKKTVAPSRATYHFTVSAADFSGTYPAIFLKKFTDTAEISVNGSLLTPPISAQSRNWNQPLYAVVPPAILNQGANEISITLSANWADIIHLFPVQIGDSYALHIQYDLSMIYRAGMPRIGLGLALFGSVFFAALSVLQQDIFSYRWLTAICVANAVFLIHPVFRIDPLPYRIWLISWTSAIHFQIYALHRFASLYTGRREVFTERVWLTFLTLGSLVFLLGPRSAGRDVLLWMGLSSIVFALSSISQLLKSTNIRQRRIQLFLFVILSSILALGVTEFLRQIGWATFKNTEVYQFAPILLFAAILFILAHNLLVAENRNSRLLAKLRQKVIGRTRELGTSRLQLIEAGRRAVREEERQRILLDLHDGIGGQLVNVLAYMSMQPNQDLTLRKALEAALMDLSLIIDSLETENSVSTLLGTLRERVEPLLNRHNLKFDWQIEAEPILPVEGPSQNLLLLRIVQEAFTNIVKHAKATIVLVQVTENMIKIQDNGIGFDVVSLAKQEDMVIRHGLISMKRRAEALGSQLKVDSNTEGTSVTLFWEIGTLSRELPDNCTSPIPEQTYTKTSVTGMPNAV